MTSFIFAERKVSSQYSSNGRSPIGIKHLGHLLVRKFRRVPKPAASSKALTSFICQCKVQLILDRINEIAIFSLIENSIFLSKLI